VLRGHADAVANQLMRAHLLLRLNRPREAGEIAARAAASAPHEPDAWVTLARCYAMSDQPLPALRAANRAVALDPVDPTPHVIAAEVLGALGNPTEAERAARRAVELGPFDASAHARLAIALAQLAGRPEMFGFFWRRCLRTAQHHAKRAIELCPAGTTGHFAAGFVAARGDRSRQARAHYRRVLAVDPQHAAALNNLAVLDMTSGRLVRSGNGFRRALVADPSMALARRNIIVMLTTVATIFHFAGWLIYSCFSAVAAERGPFALAWTTRSAIALCLVLIYVAVAGLVCLRMDRRIRAFARNVVIRGWPVRATLAFDLATAGCFALAVFGSGDVASAAYQLGFAGMLGSIIGLAGGRKLSRRSST
jgi:Flp pilus assembly protein TadD